jgi:hypothetical protein
MSSLCSAIDTAATVRAHSISPHSSLKPYTLRIRFPEGVTFRIMTSPDGDSFTFEGIYPNTLWESLPLNVGSAKHLLAKLPFTDRTKDLLFGIITSEVWKWSRTL